MTLGSRKALKWGLWTAVLLLLTGLQTAPAFSSVVSPVLGVAVTVSVLLSESNEIGGCGFAAAAGLLWDVSAGKLLGYYGLMLLMAGVTIDWLLANFLRRTAGSAVLLTAAVTFLCRLVDSELYLFIWGYAGENIGQVLGEILLQSLLTGLCAGVLFPFMRFIGRRTMGEEPSSLRLRHPFTPENPRNRRR